MLHKKIFRIMLFSSMGVFMSIFCINIFLDSWAASVGVGISLTIFDSSTGNNNGNTGNNNGNTGNNNGNTGNNNLNTGNNNLNTGWINTGSNSGKGSGNNISKPNIKDNKLDKEDKIPEKKPVFSSGLNNSGSDIHFAPSSGSINMTGNKVEMSIDDSNNSAVGDNSASVKKNLSNVLDKSLSKEYKEKIEQVEKNKKTESKDIKLIEKNTQYKIDVCDDIKESDDNVLSKIKTFAKVFLYGEKTNTKTSILCVTGTKDNVSGSFISMSGTLKTKSGIVKNIISSHADYVEKDKVDKKTGLISKISGSVLKKTTDVMSSLNNTIKKIPTHMIKSLLLGNRVVEHFIKSVFSYFR